MIKSKATTTETKKLPIDLEKTMKEIQQGYVLVGVHEDAGQYTNEDGTRGPMVAEVAMWNEFGTRTSPERSFMRSATDENMPRINAWREELLSDIFTGKKTVSKALAALGFRIQTLIQNKIKSNVPPPNAPSTVAHKQGAGTLPKGGSAKEMIAGSKTGTLIDSGLMLRSITFKVKKK